MNFELVSHATKCPRKNMELCWPRILLCLEALGLSSRNVKIASLATIAVETAWTFLPIHEFGSNEYLNRMYDTRTDLGNTPDKDGDGARYAGRGFIQITGHSNYEKYGKLMGVDLLDSPDKAMDVDVAAFVFAAYFHEHKLNVPAESGDWKRVRKLVNGGTNGLQEFINVVSALEQIPEGEL